jgi:hypothetical protein
VAETITFVPLLPDLSFSLLPEKDFEQSRVVDRDGGSEASLGARHADPKTGTSALDCGRVSGSLEGHTLAMLVG